MSKIKFRDLVPGDVLKGDIEILEAPRLARPQMFLLEKWETIVSEPYSMLNERSVRVVHVMVSRPNKRYSVIGHRSE